MTPHGFRVTMRHLDGAWTEAQALRPETTPKRAEMIGRSLIRWGVYDRVRIGCWAVDMWREWAREDDIDPGPVN
jgi:hypothetical protein